MSWLHELFFGASSSAAGATAHACLVLGLTAALGVALGTIPIAGIRLGVAGVLFVGLVFGHFHIGPGDEVLAFAQDFGLILFVYTIGIQIGPGFGASLRKQGVPLNIMAAAIVLIGAAITVLLGRYALPRAEFPAMVGVFSGATTNTPSLAAAQQVLSVTDPASIKLPALGFAVTYPVGVIGIIVSMFLVRSIFGIDVKQEAKALASATGQAPKKLEARSVEITNDDLSGMKLDELLSQTPGSVVVSRVMQASVSAPHVATGDEVIEAGDVLLAVGPPDEVESFARMVGEHSEVDLKEVPSSLTTRNLLVTRKAVIGKSVPELSLTDQFGVAGTRILRGDIEMAATSDVKIMFGDRVTVVGEEAPLKDAARLFGDSADVRDHPMVIPMFLGIVIGVLIGSIPLPVPGFPVPLKLGLAGGPLVAALLLGRIGKIGPLVWYMPRAANLTVREIGIILFLACVGIKAGDRFVDTLVHGHGLLWMAYGAMVTVVPLLIVAGVGRLFVKLNYLPMCGLMAGSTTAPPALALATSMTRSEAPSVAYASVYPLVMLLRILTAQLLILFFR